MVIQEWFYSVGEEKMGPVSTARMLEMSEAGEFTDETLVWAEGLPDWIPASSCNYAEDYATCEISGEVRPVSEMLEYGNKYILPEYKEQFVQALHEGGDRSNMDLFWTEYEFVDPGSRATLAKGGVIFGIITSVLALVAFVVGMMSSEFDSEFGGGSDELMVSLMVIAGFLFLLGWIVPTVFYCMWVHRVSKNAHVIKKGDLSQTPGWAVGFHFVPIANLWKPLTAISEIYNVSGSRPLQSMDNLVVWWWVCWLVYTVGSNILGGLALPAGIACLILWWIIVSRITRWQQQKAGLE